MNRYISRTLFLGLLAVGHTQSNAETNIHQSKLAALTVAAATAALLTYVSYTNSPKAKLAQAEATCDAIAKDPLCTTPFVDQEKISLFILNNCSQYLFPLVRAARIMENHEHNAILACQHIEEAMATEKSEDFCNRAQIVKIHLEKQITLLRSSLTLIYALPEFATQLIAYNASLTKDKKIVKINNKATNYTKATIKKADEANNKATESIKDADQNSKDLALLEEDALSLAHSKIRTRI